MQPAGIDPKAEAAEQDETGLSWSDMLLAYRDGHSQRAAEALLDGLGPWLTNARLAVLAAEPFADADDVSQQLCLEVLAKASRWRPDCEDRWIPRRLVEQAERKVRQAHIRERLRRPDELDEYIAAPVVDCPELMDTPIGKATAADMRVMRRYYVDGERLGDLAAEAGITPRQMRRRIQKARARARIAC